MRTIRGQTVPLAITEARCAPNCTAMPSAALLWWNSLTIFVIRFRPNTQGVVATIGLEGLNLHHTTPYNTDILLAFAAGEGRLRRLGFDDNRDYCVKSVAIRSSNIQCEFGHQLRRLVVRSTQYVCSTEYARPGSNG
jgi:hypothetical protein